MQEMYVVGKKADESFVARSGIYYSPIPNNNTILTNIIKKFGGIAAHYNVFKVTDFNEQDRIMNSDSFLLTWESNIITGIDFTPENSKKFIEFSVDKNVVLRNGTDFIIMQAKILNSDGVTVDTTFNDTLSLPVGVPYGGHVVKIRGKFTDGVMSRQFMPEALGGYFYPDNKVRFGNLRVKNQILIESEFEV